MISNSDKAKLKAREQSTHLVRHRPWRRRIEKVLVGAFNIMVELVLIW